MRRSLGVTSRRRSKKRDLFGKLRMRAELYLELFRGSSLLECIGLLEKQKLECGLSRIYAVAAEQLRAPRPKAAERRCDRRPAFQGRLIRPGAARRVATFDGRWSGNGAPSKHQG